MDYEHTTREQRATIKRRRAQTLKRWFNELNRWGWPKELGEPEPRKGANGRRDALMCAILEELGLRYIQGKKLN